MACETCLAEKLAYSELKLAAIRKFASEPGNWGGVWMVAPECSSR